MPKKKEKGSKIFGSKLEINKPVVPDALEQLLTELEKKGGIEAEGIFRISGSVPMVRKLKEIIDEGGDKIDFSGYSVHDVAGATKMYFRELQDPLFTFDLYPCFIAAGASGDKDEILKAIGLLPVGNKVVLNRLLSFLYKVIQLSNINKMTPENLATCLVPNLLRQKTETMESTIIDYPFLISLFTELIENYEFYFKKEIDEQKKKKDAMKERALHYKKMMEQKYKKNEPADSPPPPEEEPQEEKREDTPADVNFRNTMNAKYKTIKQNTLTRLTSKKGGASAMEFQAMLENQFQRIQSGDASIQELRDLLEVPEPSRSKPPQYDPPKPPVPARKPNLSPSTSAAPIHNTLPSPSFRYSMDITSDALDAALNLNDNSSNNAGNSSNYINYSNHHLGNVLEAGRNRSWTSFDGLNSEANPSDIRELLKTLPSIPSQLNVAEKINAAGSSSPTPPPRPPRK